MSGPVFNPWPKTPRLYRDCIITEKIDGTNAAVIIEPGDPTEGQWGWCAGVMYCGQFFKVGAQSRNRIIFPGQDNAGFAAWVHAHAHSLVADLGEGYHFGEWWGSGIQRGYGLPKGEKRFSLFNVTRWATAEFITPRLGVVHTYAVAPFSDQLVHRALDSLRRDGSWMAGGFMRPEGIVVYMPAAGHGFKVTLEGDHLPKTIVNLGREVTELEYELLLDQEPDADWSEMAAAR